MPYKSDAQRGWAHTPEGTKALGGAEKVHEWDQASKGKKLPDHVGKEKHMSNKLQFFKEAIEKMKAGKVGAHMGSHLKPAASVTVTKIEGHPDHVLPHLGLKAEGSPEEEASESPAEAQAEGDEEAPRKSPFLSRQGK